MYEHINSTSFKVELKIKPIYYNKKAQGGRIEIHSENTSGIYQLRNLIGSNDSCLIKLLNNNKTLATFASEDALDRLTTVILDTNNTNINFMEEFKSIKDEINQNNPSNNPPGNNNQTQEEQCHFSTFN